MAAVVPYGDRALAGLRGEIVPPGPGQANGLLDLGGFYGLHPALTGLHDMYSANEALAVHAVAGSYRVRSHFEAQDCLESGADHRMTSGWLNRAVASLPPAETARPGGEALAVGVSVPLLLRGQAVVANWAPRGFSQPSPDLYATIAALNQSDPVTGPAIAEGLRARGFSASVMTPRRTAQRQICILGVGPSGRRVAGRGGWSANRGVGNRRLGHPRRASQSSDGAAQTTRYGIGRVENRARSGLGADSGSGHDRIRPHSPGQRHQGH